MKLQRIAGLFAAAGFALTAAGFAQAGNEGVCDNEADYCLVDDFGTVFNLWVSSSTPPNGVSAGDFIGYADVDPSIFPPDGLLCPITGDFVVVGSLGSEQYVNVGITSNCSCDENGTPAKRTMLLTLNTSTTPPTVLDNALMTAHSFRCDGSIDMFRGAEVGPAPTSTIFAPTTTPDFETLLTPP
jgi:hypothetical protein